MDRPVLLADTTDSADAIGADKSPGGAPSVVHSSATGRRCRGRNATEQQEE
jgi:hypothetical protein